MAYFTGLEVSHEPGQWGVWAGVVLMGLGLALVFYFVHARVWVVPVRDARGQRKLWIGGTANKNKDVFEQRFRELAKQIESELKISSQAGADSLCHRTRRKVRAGTEDASMAQVARAEQQPAATGSTLVVMVGLGSCVPAIHGISQRGQERQPA